MLTALRELRYLKCLLLSCTSVAKATHVVCSALSSFLPFLLSDPIDTATVWAFDVSTFEFGGYLQLSAASAGDSLIVVQPPHQVGNFASTFHFT